jgi:hypothetical protein
MKVNFFESKSCVTRNAGGTLKCTRDERFIVQETGPHQPRSTPKTNRFIHRRRCCSRFGIIHLTTVNYYRF